MALAENRLYTVEDYWNLPEDERAELINGELVALAAPSRIHQDILMELAGTVRDYIKQKGGSCRVYPAPFAVKLKEGDQTIVEPDISVICDPNKLNDKGCNGAPDWIIEIVSPSTSGHDYIRKLGLYAAAGVREYWIVNPMKQIVTVYFFDGEGTAQLYAFKEPISCNVFDDLTIDLSDFS